MMEQAANIVQRKTSEFREHHTDITSSKVKFSGVGKMSSYVGFVREVV
jgi:hypothetical protein